MLVSAIATFQAINAQNRAGMAIMQTHNAMLSGIRGAGASETNFNALHTQDVKNDAANIKAQIMYQMAAAWKEHSENQLKKELKQGLDYKA